MTHETPGPGDRCVDLHAHTTASDGDHTPTQLVRHAADSGLRVLGITDHDTIGGLSEAMHAGEECGVEVVPGVELSVEATAGQLHLLGYFIEPFGSALDTRLQRLRENRARRNDRLIENLNALGIEITLAEVKALAGSDVVARPHFARVLVAKDVVKTTQEAFDKYLASGAAAHVPKDKIKPDEAIELIHGAGGLAIVAHPNNMKLDDKTTDGEIERLCGFGVDGIEARYSKHTAEATARYLALASRLGLLTTGGSDFHGPSVKPNIKLGHVEDERPAPYSMFADLKAAWLDRSARAEQGRNAGARAAATAD